MSHRLQRIRDLKRELMDKAVHHERRSPVQRRLVHLITDQLAAECGKPRKHRAYNRRMAS